MSFRAPVRRRRQPRQATAAGLLALLVLSLLVAACGDGDASDAGPVTVGAESDADDAVPDTTTSTTQDPEAALIAEVEAAYEEINDAYVAVVTDPDPADPTIDSYFTGASEATLRRAVEAFSEGGLAAQIPDDPSLYNREVIDIRLIGDAQAEIEECVVDGAHVIRVSDGEVLDDNIVVSRNVMTIEKSEGRWRSANYERLGEGPDAGCDV